MTVATDAEAGRNCPYCRFPLKAGVAVERCSACDAVHHQDCWVDGGGCSIFGCSAAGTMADIAAVPSPPPPVTGKHSVVLDAPPPPPPPPQTPRSSSTRAVVIAMIAVVLVLVAGVGGFVLTSRDDDNSAVAEETSDDGSASQEGDDSVDAPPVEDATAVALSKDTPEPEPTPDLEAEALRQAETIADIVEYSLEGRTAVREGRYADAVSNRRTVLRRLAAIRGATGDVAVARRTLRRAMRASLNADIAYQNGTDASAYDAEATRYKQQFVQDWAAVAAEHDLAEYAPGDI